MTELGTRERERLALILGMLGSEHCGERDAAALAAVRFLRECRLSWSDVLSPAALASAQQRAAEADGARRAAEQRMRAAEQRAEFAVKAAADRMKAAKREPGGPQEHLIRAAVIRAETAEARCLDADLRAAAAQQRIRLLEQQRQSQNVALDLLHRTLARNKRESAERRRRHWVFVMLSWGLVLLIGAIVGADHTGPAMLAPVFSSIGAPG